MKLTEKNIIDIIKIMVILSILMLIDIHLKADYSILITFSNIFSLLWFIAKHIIVGIIILLLIKYWKNYKGEEKNID